MNIIDALSREVHAANVAVGWWTDLKTGASLLETRNVGELLCLVHSEISEAFDGMGRQDDKLPHRSMFEVELADVNIRIFDIAGAKGLDLGATIEELYGVRVGFPVGTPVASNHATAMILNTIGVDVMSAHRKLWTDDGYFRCILRTHSAVSEAMEGHRKGTMSAELPGRTQFEVGLARAVALTLALGEWSDLDVGGAIVEKLAFNATRADHKVENRRAAGGKAY